MALDAINIRGQRRPTIPEERDMVENTGAAAPTPAVADEPDAVVGAVESPLVEEELLVEDVSIDGMCGVY
jgi:mycofactocin precursor